MRANLTCVFGSALALGLAFVACGGVNPGEVVIVDDEPSAGRGGAMSDAGAGNGDSGATGSAGDAGDAGDGGSGGLVPTQPGPPRVVRVVPADEAAAASPTSAIVLTFSEPLLAASVTADSVQVKDAAGATLPGTLSYQNAVVRFVPNARLTLEATYAVSVSTDVQDTEGTGLDGAFASSFVVRPGAWSTEGTLSTTAMGNGAPVLASDGKGRALAVWARLQKAGSVLHDIVGKLYTPGQGWGPEVIIDSSQEDAIRPSVAMSASGNAVVAWLEGGSHIGARRYTAGKWEPAALAVSVLVDKPLVTGVSAAISPTETAHVSWLQQETANGVTSRHTYTSHAVTGAAWEATPQVLAFSDEGNDTELPSLAFDANGDGLAVFSNVTFTTDYVSSARYFESGGGWEVQGGIPDSNGEELGPASIASNGMGLVVAVWSSTTGGVTDIDAALYKSGWVGPSMVLSNGPANDLASVHWTGKKFLALWHSKVDDALISNELDMALKPAPVAVSAALKDVGSYAVASDGRGNTLAVWAHAAQNKGVLSYARLPSTASIWSVPATLPGAAEARGLPAVALHPDGSANGVWAGLSDSPNAPVVTGIVHTEFE